MNLLPIIANSGFRPIDATGGTVTDITVSGVAWRVHSFSTTGTLTVNDIGDEGKIEYLVVAGGGAGGSAVTSSTAGGGGGGGGVRTNVGGTMNTVSAGSHTITVGTGGTVNGGTFIGQGGTNSSLPSSLTGAEIAATGGGRGGLFGTYPGGNGGSGGGGGTSSTSAAAGGTGNAGGFSPAEGTDGSSGSAILNRAGGGGGAGAAATSINGGAGVANLITGASVTYAPGGNGGDIAVEANGANATAIGGGGGGAADGVPDRVGGNGANGIVVIRYPLEAL